MNYSDTVMPLAKRILGQYAHSFDPQKATERLLGELRKQMDGNEKDTTFYKKIAEISGIPERRVRNVLLGTYKKIAEISGISERRLKYILNEAKSPKLRKKEVILLCAMIDKSISDDIFLLPPIEDEIVKELVRERFGSYGFLNKPKNLEHARELVRDAFAPELENFNLGLVAACLDKYPD